MKRKHLIATTTIIFALLLLFFGYRLRKGSGEEALFATVQRGLFEVTVVTTGELSSRNNTKIEAPQGIRARNVRFSEIKIQDLVPEGTMVKEGDYVARLDRSSAENDLKDLEDELERLRAKQERILLDTALTLRGARNVLLNLRFDLEEKKIAVEQSVYEPPATQRQVKNALEKALRDWDQEQKNYQLKVEQAEANVQDGLLEFSRKERQYNEMLEVLSKFVIRAPAAGMVIYHRNWYGEKLRVGSSINPNELTVATLPDLSSLISTTQVNEIDINKIKVGNRVRIGIDALPDKEYHGKVTEVSNVGANNWGVGAKLFEVVIQIDPVEDQLLKPSMTTSNTVITASEPDKLFVPLEAIYGDETGRWVYRSNGSRQVVELGLSNENFCVVERGLEAGDKIYLSEPKKR